MDGYSKGGERIDAPKEWLETQVKVEVDTQQKDIFPDIFYLLKLFISFS